MPDLTDDLPVHIPALLRPGSVPEQARQSPDDDPRRRAVWIDPEAARLMATARGLLDRLLDPVVTDREAATVALLRVGEREGRRQRNDDRPDVSAGLPLADRPLPLVGEVEGVIAGFASAPLPEGLMGRAAMGVEFVAGVEAASPGAVEAVVSGGDVSGDGVSGGDMAGGGEAGE